jgi:hypothetical protein
MKRSHHKQPAPLDAVRARIDAEVERERVVEDFRRSLVEVRVRTLSGRRRRSEMHVAAVEALVAAGAK